MHRRYHVVNVSTPTHALQTLDVLYFICFPPQCIIYIAVSFPEKNRKLLGTRHGSYSPRSPFYRRTEMKYTGWDSAGAGALIHHFELFMHKHVRYL